MALLQTKPVMSPVGMLPDSQCLVSRPHLILCMAFHSRFDQISTEPFAKIPSLVPYQECDTVLCNMTYILVKHHAKQYRTVWAACKQLQKC